jgi:hypothetical protein
MFKPFLLEQLQYCEVRSSPTVLNRLCQQMKLQFFGSVYFRLCKYAFHEETAVSAETDHIRTYLADREFPVKGGNL